MSMGLLHCMRTMQDILHKMSQMLLPTSCRPPPKPSINAVRIKPSNAQSSSSQEQGEPPTKKLKAQQDDSQNATLRQATAQPQVASHAAATSMPAASQPDKAQAAPAVEAPKTSLTAMLGKHQQQ